MSEMPSPVEGYLDCEWPLDPGCLGDTWESMEPDVQVRAQALAGATLRRLTGYRVGGCPSTVRPCKRSCWNAFMGYGFNPHINENSQWVNSCGCSDDCACATLCEISLPGPVGEVYSITIGATTLDVGTYRVMGNKVVWFGDGDCPFPVCQDMGAPVGDPDTFSITYLNAYPVDTLGAWAGGVLAVEFAAACVGRGKCRLPANVTNIVRQGVSFEIAGGAFPGGFTGIREVDAYIALWNPDGLKRPPTVWTPNNQVRAERV